jgi:hypothetical protein
VFLWGIWELVIAGLGFWAGSSLLRGNSFGRVIGYIWAIVVIVENFTSLRMPLCRVRGRVALVHGCPR